MVRHRAVATASSSPHRSRVGMVRVGTDNSPHPVSTEAASRAMERSKAMGTKLSLVTASSPQGATVNSRAMGRVMVSHHNLNHPLLRGHRPVVPPAAHHQAVLEAPGDPLREQEMGLDVSLFVIEAGVLGSPHLNNHYATTPSLYHHTESQGNGGALIDPHR